MSKEKKIVFDEVQELVDSHQGIYMAQRMMEILRDLGEKDFFPMPPDPEDAEKIEVDGHSVLEHIAHREWMLALKRDMWNALTTGERITLTKSGKDLTNFKEGFDFSIDSKEWEKSKEKTIKKTKKEWHELYDWEREEAENRLDELCAPNCWFAYRESDGSAVITTFQCDECDQFDPDAEEIECSGKYLCKKCLAKHKEQEENNA